MRFLGPLETLTGEDEFDLYRQATGDLDDYIAAASILDRKNCTCGNTPEDCHCTPVEEPTVYQPFIDLDLDRNHGGW